jgi:hypothetical protein
LKTKIHVESRDGTCAAGPVAKGIVLVGFGRRSAVRVAPTGYRRGPGNCNVREIIAVVVYDGSGNRRGICGVQRNGAARTGLIKSGHDRVTVDVLSSGRGNGHIIRDECDAAGRIYVEIREGIVADILGECRRSV